MMPSINLTPDATEDETMPTPTEDYPWPSRDVGSLIEIPIDGWRCFVGINVFFSVLKQINSIEVGSCSQIPEMTAN